MLKEILLTDDERDTILGLCQYQLSRIKSLTVHSIMIRKSACARLGLVICKVKGHEPHYNEAYVAAKGGWKRMKPYPTMVEDTLTSIDHITDFTEERIVTCPRNTVTLTKDKYDFRTTKVFDKRYPTKP